MTPFFWYILKSAARRSGSVSWVNCSGAVAHFFYWFWRSGSRLLSKLWQALLNGHLSDRQGTRKYMKISLKIHGNTVRKCMEITRNTGKPKYAKMRRNTWKYKEIRGNYAKLHFTRCVAWKCMKTTVSIFGDAKGYPPPHIFSKTKTYFSFLRKNENKKKHVRLGISICPICILFAEILSFSRR